MNNVFVMLTKLLIAGASASIISACGAGGGGSGGDEGSTAIEYSVDGYSMTTSDATGTMEDSVLVASVTLPNDSVMMIPYIFYGEPGNTNITVSFDGVELEIIAGYPFISEVQEILVVDIAAVQSQTGELRITLASTGETEAELLLIEAIR